MQSQDYLCFGVTIGETKAASDKGMTTGLVGARQTMAAVVTRGKT